MGSLENRRAEVASQIDLAIQDWGLPRVAGALEINSDALAALLNGMLEMPAGAVATLERRLAASGMVIEAASRPTPKDVVGEYPGPELAREVDLDADLGLDGDRGLDGDGDLSQAPVRPMEQVRSQLLDKREGARLFWWYVRDQGIRAQNRLGMTEWEVTAAFWQVTEAELMLMRILHESMPDTGAKWGIERREKEIERRLGRLRLVDDEFKKEYRGWKGLWNRLLGRIQPTVEDLKAEVYQRILDDPDAFRRIIRHYR